VRAAAREARAVCEEAEAQLQAATGAARLARQRPKPRAPLRQPGRPRLLQAEEAAERVDLERVDSDHAGRDINARGERVHVGVRGE